MHDHKHEQMDIEITHMIALITNAKLKFGHSKASKACLYVAFLSNLIRLIWYKNVLMVGNSKQNLDLKL